MKISYNLSIEEYLEGRGEAFNLTIKTPIRKVVYIGITILYLAYCLIGYNQIDILNILVNVVVLLVGLFILEAIGKKIMVRIRLKNRKNDANKMAGEQIIEINKESMIYSNSNKYKDFILNRDNILYIQELENYILIEISEKGTAKTNMLIMPKNRITDSEREIILNLKKYGINNSVKISYYLSNEEYAEGCREELPSFKKVAKVISIGFIIVCLGVYFIKYREVMTMNLVIEISLAILKGVLLLIIILFIEKIIADKVNLKRWNNLACEMAGEQIIEINKQSMTYSNSGRYKDFTLYSYTIVSIKDYEKYIVMAVSKNNTLKMDKLIIPKNKITENEKEMILGFKTYSMDYSLKNKLARKRT